MVRVAGRYLRTGRLAHEMAQGRVKFVLPVRGNRRKLDVSATQATAIEVNGFRKRLANDVYEKLHSHLQSYRYGMAQKQGKSGFLVLPNPALISLCVRLPKTVDELRECDGISSKKMKNAGEMMREMWIWLRARSVVPTGPATCVQLA